VADQEVPGGGASGTAEADLADSEDRVAAMSRTHRAWVVPIVRALDALGGSARPLNVEAQIWTSVKDRLNQQQWAFLIRNKYIRWARHSLAKAGLLGGEHGIWALTDAGRRYHDAHAGDDLDLPNVPELSPEESGDLSAPLQTLAATTGEGYFVPILEVLSKGAIQRQELKKALDEPLQGKLLPGDLGIQPNGAQTWWARVGWELSALKKEGSVRSLGHGAWEITDAGRARLAAEGGRWSIETYQTSKSRVRPAGAEGAVEAGPEDEDFEFDAGRWQALSAKIGELVFRVLNQRLRPDLGPTPELDGLQLPRNVILYGPPGTGKTFIATAVAEVLTGESERQPDGRWRVVQFHPSYSYEDFIQGLRPDLEQTTLRYHLAKGPFVQLCELAKDDPDHFYVMVIDEINRGDPARIFGELLYALEYRGQAVDLPTGGQLSVPPNLIVIGTMNSVDRSVALVDYALRRRFGFVRVEPDPEVVIRVRKAAAFSSVAAEVLEAFNSWITKRRDREHVIGHSFFLNPAIDLDSVDAFAQVWDIDVKPLLEEYFFGDPESVAEAEKCWNGTVAEAVATLKDEEAESEADAEATQSPSGNGPRAPRPK
jgi:5-methylcytosine-specific restriction enzyme B